MTAACHIEDCPERHCVCCRQRRHLDETQAQTCIHCLGQTRRDLYQILDLTALLPTLIDGYPSRHGDTRGSTSRAAEPPLPGGDALALLAGGSDAHTQIAGHWIPAHQAPGHWHKGTWIDGAWIGDHYQLPDHALDEQPDDPPSALHELVRWDTDWRRQLGLPQPAGPDTITSVIASLRANLTWAAQHHDDYPAFTADITQLRRRLEQATGISDRPVTSPVPCLGCGGRLTRHWRTPDSNGRNGGLADRWTCKQCRREYDDAEYYLAMREQAQPAEKA